MTKTLQGLQTNFTSGVLSPRLWAHIDVSKYKNGLKTGINSYCLPHGPIVRRSGTVFINEVKTSSKEVKLIRFQFNQDNAYILEFGHQYIRFYKNGGQIQSGGSPYELSTTYTESEVQEITYVQFGRVIYIAHAEHPPASLTWTSDTSWVLEDVFFYPPPTDEDGFKPAATITPGATSGLSVTFTANGGVFLPADVGRQIHNLSGTGKASIISYTNNTTVVCDILENFPNTSAIASQSWKMDLSPIAKLEMDNSGTGTTSTLTSFYTDSFRGPAKSIATITRANPGVLTVSGGHGFTDGDKVELKNIQGMPPINNAIWAVKEINANDFSLLSSTGSEVDTTIYQPYAGGGIARKVFADIFVDAFRSDDVDRYILINGGIGLVTEIPDAHTAKIELQKSLNAITSTSAWSIEEEAWTSTKGYPRVIALHQQRIWFGGTDNAPQTVWGSSPAIFDSIGVGGQDDDAISFDLAASEVNQIQWMYGLRDQLIIGTSGAEITIGSGVQAGPITSSSITADSRTYSGSKLQQPIALENEVLYIQRSGTKINSFRYNFEIDNYLSDDLVFLAEHLPRDGGGIKEIAYAQDPDRLVYAVLNDGTMMIGTYYRDQQVIAWTLYNTDGLFENIQTISTGINDEVWVVVKRTIDGSTKRYIERFDSVNMSQFGINNTEVFSDCALTLSLPKTVTGITKANPGVVTANSHGFSNGDQIKLFDIGGMEEVVGKTYVVANKTANTFELTTVSGSNVNTTTFTDYTSGGEVFKLFSTVSGLNHLESKSVEIKADGAAHATKIVTGGSITLDRPAYEVTVGLSYESEIHTLQREFNLGLGSQQGQPARWVHPILRLYRSCLPTLNGEFLPARTPQDLMDNKVELVTGDVEYGNLDWGTDSSLTITINKPFPFVLLGIFGMMEAGVK